MIETPFLTLLGFGFNPPCPLSSSYQQTGFTEPQCGRQSVTTDVLCSLCHATLSVLGSSAYPETFLPAPLALGWSHGTSSYQWKNLEQGFLEADVPSPFCFSLFISLKQRGCLSHKVKESRTPNYHTGKAAWCPGTTIPLDCYVSEKQTVSMLHHQNVGVYVLPPLINNFINSSGYLFNKGLRGIK